MAASIARQACSATPALISRLFRLDRGADHRARVEQYEQPARARPTTAGHRGRRVRAAPNAPVIRCRSSTTARVRESTGCAARGHGHPRPKPRLRRRHAQHSQQRGRLPSARPGPRPRVAPATEFAAVREVVERAADRDAHERSRRFRSAPLTLSFAAARQGVEARTEDLAQVRPELGHATNGISIVGRRETTRGLFLDRRAFLTSYDPTQDDADGTDPGGGSLGAVFPVCAGINLEYYFSHVDNNRWGSGTKLPHNIASLLGVMNGAASDLRTGLPWQMVEIHEPVRLLFLIETSTGAMTRIMDSRCPAVSADARRRNEMGAGWRRASTPRPTDASSILRRTGAFRPGTSRRRRSHLPSVAASPAGRGIAGGATTWSSPRSRPDPAPPDPARPLAMPTPPPLLNALGLVVVISPFLLAIMPWSRPSSSLLGSERSSEVERRPRAGLLSRMRLRPCSRPASRRRRRPAA